MRKLLVAFIILSALASRPASAAVVLTITNNPDPISGLQSVTVTVDSTAGETLLNFSDIVISGASVHQIWPVGSTGTTTREQLTGALTYAQGSEVFDTHLLIPAADILTTIGTTSETNDASNPLGLTTQLVPNSPFNAFPSTAGMGSFSQSVGTSIQLLPAAQDSSVALLQIVTTDAEFLNALLSLEVVFEPFGGGPVQAVSFDNVAIAVPEPGAFLTAALVGLFGLGRFAVRRRRKAV